MSVLQDHGMAVRELQKATDEIERLRKVLEQIKARCAGDRAPYWTDDWQTTHSRGVILDLCDSAMTPRVMGSIRAGGELP